MSKRMCLLILCLALLLGTARAELCVRFLDVGQGDAALVQCDGEAMLIDGGSAAASQYLYSCLRESVTELAAIVATHPHDDHVGGLAAVLNAVPVGIIYSPVEAWNSIAWKNVVKYAGAQGVPIVVPGEGDAFRLGGASVAILHCWPDAWTENDMSIVLRVDYGETSFLFTGDAEAMSEEMMLGDRAPLKADVLKVAHHGSGRSTTPGFIAAVDPDWAVISCGRENAFGHPSDKVLKALAGAKVLRTDEAGTITFRSDGTALSVTTAARPAIETNYIGNRKTMKFHLPGCEAAAEMAEANKVPLAAREDALEMGFTACGQCRP